MISKRVIFILILLLLFLGAVYASQKRVRLPIYTGTLHPENTDRYGTAEFVKLLQDSGFRVSKGGTQDLFRGEYGLYILIGPDFLISPEEAREILSYLMNGGTAIIASEFNDIESILKIFDIYPSNLITQLNPDELKDPLITISCSICESFDTIELDLPSSFVIAATTDDLNTRFRVLEEGDDYFIYRYSVNGITFTATASGKIVDLNGEFKTPVTKGLFGEITTRENFVYTLDLLQYTAFSGNTIDEITIFTNDFTIIFIDIEGGGRIVFISDTSPFINFYLEKERTTPLIYDIIGFLQPPNQDVLIDVNHYDIIETSIKLPHLGRMILASLQQYIKQLDKEYTSIFSENTLLLMGTITLVGLSMFTSLRRYLKIRDEAQLAGEDVVERDIIISTDTLIPMKDIYGKNFKEFVSNTYSFASILISELYGVSITDIIYRRVEVDDDIYNSVKYIYKIYNRVSRKIVFPLIFNKRGVVNRLLKSLDVITSKGGVNR